MGPAQCHDAGLHLGAHLMRAGGRAAGVIDEAGETQGGVAPQPVVHGLAGHPIAGRATSTTGSPPKTSKIALCRCSMNPNSISIEGDLLFLGATVRHQREVWVRKQKSLRKCRLGTGTSVAQVPERVSEVSGRYRIHFVR